MEREKGYQENAEVDLSQYSYHHTRPLEYIRYGNVSQVKSDDEYYHRAFSWLEKQVGFYPLFMAVGKSEEDLQVTGYQGQWRRLLGTNDYRKKGDIENQVLFSFEEQSGVYMDYMNWHLVLNATNRDYQMTDFEKKLIFKPSWKKSDWLRYARHNPAYVQMVVPDLDLSQANSIWVRNKDTKKRVEEMGFDNVEVRRLRVPSF